MNQYLDTSVNSVPLLNLEWLEAEVPLDEDFSTSTLFFADSDTINNFTIDYIYRLNSCII